MRFVFPTLAYKEKAAAYIQEFIEHGSQINGTGSLDRYLRESTYEEWLDKVMRAIDIANIVPPKVPALTYFCVREEDDRIVGMVNIRLALNDFLTIFSGKRAVISDTVSVLPNAESITPQRCWTRHWMCAGASA